MIGRRVETIDDLERAGDYCRCPITDSDGSTEDSVWFLLPVHTPGASKFAHGKPGDGLHRCAQPPHVFRECGDGSLEIRESIATKTTVKGKEVETWHGYLDQGNVWRGLGQWANI